MTSTARLLPWQAENWRQLCQYEKQRRIPQALLVSGRQGIGKLALARQFALSLLCEKAGVDGFACGQCRSCAMAADESHPDFFFITPKEDKKSISINQIRDIIADAALMPQYERYRVVILHPADSLTISAANAFLKCLEEPTARTLFILVTDSPSRLPATIVSRCQKLMAASPGPAMLETWLLANQITDDRLKLVSLCSASIASYRQFLDTGLFQHRRDCFQDWMALASQKDWPALVAEKWEKLPKIDLLNWMLTWVADIIRHKQGATPTLLYNQDFIPALQQLALQLDLKALFGLYDKLLANRPLIDTQVNFQNMLEELLVHWLEINRS